VFGAGEHFEGAGNGLFVAEEEGEGHGSPAKFACEDVAGVGVSRA
jgi:hypothetical protein